MKTYQELLEKAPKKPNPYDKPKTDGPKKTDYVKYPDHLTHHVDGWETVKTSHASDREGERGHMPGGHHDFMKKVVGHVSKVTHPKNGEYLYVSKKHDQGVVVNVNHEHKQVRAITVLPPGRHHPKEGTKKIMVEGIEFILPTVILEDED